MLLIWVCYEPFQHELVIFKSPFPPCKERLKQMRILMPRGITDFFSQIVRMLEQILFPSTPQHFQESIDIQSMLLDDLNEDGLLFFRPKIPLRLLLNRYLWKSLVGTWISARAVESSSVTLKTILCANEFCYCLIVSSKAFDTIDESFMLQFCPFTEICQPINWHVLTQIVQLVLQ